MVRYRVYCVSFDGAGLTLLLEGLEPRDHHRQQLHDDARGDVRHDPEREHRQLQQRAAGEQVHQAEQVVGLPRLRGVQAGLHVAVVDARRRDERAEPEQRHDGEAEEQLSPQVGRLERPHECAEHDSPPGGRRSAGRDSALVTLPRRRPRDRGASALVRCRAPSRHLGEVTRRAEARTASEDLRRSQSRKRSGPRAARPGTAVQPWGWVRARSWSRRPPRSCPWPRPRTCPR